MKPNTIGGNIIFNFKVNKKYLKTPEILFPLSIALKQKSFFIYCIHALNPLGADQKFSNQTKKTH